MLVETGKNELCVDYIKWCEDVVNSLVVGNGGCFTSLSQQQIDLLNNLKDNKFNVIKSYRQAGTTTLILVKIAYDITHGTKNCNRVLFITNSISAASNAKNTLMNILNHCHEIIGFNNVKIKETNIFHGNKETNIVFSNIDALSSIGFNCDDIYIDNAAFLDMSDKTGGPEIIQIVKEILNFDKNITIASCPDKKSGFFYDLWTKVICGDIDYIDFNPICLKWYLDPRFNKKIQMEKCGNVREVKNSGMLCECLENKYYIGNRWFERLSSSLGSKSMISEINARFY